MRENPGRYNRPKQTNWLQKKWVRSAADAVAFATAFGTGAAVVSTVMDHSSDHAQKQADLLERTASVKPTEIHTGSVQSGWQTEWAFVQGENDINIKLTLVDHILNSINNPKLNKEDRLL